MATEQLDLARLNDYLAASRVGIGPIKSADKFSDGQSNPTWVLDLNPTEKQAILYNNTAQLLKLQHTPS